MALALTMTAASAAPQSGDKKITVRWHGQSFFEVTSTKGTRIVFDPHQIETYGLPDVEADLVLLSHLHNDHTQTQAIKNLKKAKILNGLKDERGDGKKVEWNQIDEKFKDEIRIRTVGVYHDHPRKSRSSRMIAVESGNTPCSARVPS